MKSVYFTLAKASDVIFTSHTKGRCSHLANLQTSITRTLWKTFTSNKQGASHVTFENCSSVHSCVFKGTSLSFENFAVVRFLIIQVPFDCSIWASFLIVLFTFLFLICLRITCFLNDYCCFWKWNELSEIFPPSNRKCLYSFFLGKNFTQIF